MTNAANQNRTLCLELGESAWLAESDGQFVELPVVRQTNGRLTEESRQRVQNRLKELLAAAGIATGTTALCAIGARGVSLRRMQLPPARAEEFEKVLSLQIEREFPLPPAQLAFGSQRIADGAVGASDVAVAAVKRELIEDALAVLGGLGLNSRFTLGVFALGVAAGGSATVTVLDVGRSCSELAIFENGVPTAVRVLPWGTDHLGGALPQQAGERSADADSLERLLRGELVPNDWPPALAGAIRNAVAELAAHVQRASSGRRLLVAGALAQVSGLPEELSRALGDGIRCEPLATGRDLFPTPTIAALRRIDSRGERGRLLELRPGGSRSEVEIVAPPASRRWLAIAAALAVAFVGLRYAGPLVRKPALERKLAEAAAARAELPPVDQELDFLRAVAKSQPAYLNALTVLADATPRGARLESLTLNGRGELTFAATLQSPQQGNELRSKLLDSGLFSSAVIEEQSPTPDQRQAKIRLSGRWRTSPDVMSPVVERISTNPPATNNPPSRGGKR